MTGRQYAALAVLIAALAVVHGLHAPAALEDPVPQQAVLARVEAVDARCREHHIAADVARAALPRLPLPHCGDGHNVWDLLQGSDDPRPIPPDEARRLLLAP